MDGSSTCVLLFGISHRTTVILPRVVTYTFRADLKGYKHNTNMYVKYNVMTTTLYAHIKQGQPLTLKTFFLMELTKAFYFSLLCRCFHVLRVTLYNNNNNVWYVCAFGFCIMPDSFLVFPTFPFSFSWFSSSSFSCILCAQI